MNNQDLLTINIKKAKNRANQLLLLLISFFVYVVAIFLLYRLGINSNDLAEYEIIWGLAVNYDFLTAFSELRYEIGSLFIFWSLGQFFSANMTFYIFGFLALTTKFYIFKKYLNYPLAAFCLYLVSFVYILDANAIRIALAISVVFYALYVKPQSIYTYLFLTLIAVMFHYSGIIILLLYFIRVPVLGLMLFILFGLLFDFLILNLDLFSFAKIWLTHPNVGQVNITSSLFLMQLCISIICAYYWHKLSEGQKKGAYLNMFGVVAYLVFIENATVAHRLRELSQIGILSVLFLGERKLTYLKLSVGVCFSYIAAYNAWHAVGKLI